MINKILLSSMAILGILLISGCVDNNGNNNGDNSIDSDGFYEDFSNYGLGDTAPFGSWKAKGNSIHIEEGIQPDGTTGKIVKIERGDLIYLNKNWRNYILEVDWRDSEPRVYFRLSNDANRGYYITKGLGYNTPVELYKFDGSSTQKIAESQGYDITGGSWGHWKIKVSENSIIVYLNDVELINTTDNDPNLVSGGIGIGSNYGGVYFDNVKINATD